MTPEELAVLGILVVTIIIVFIWFLMRTEKKGGGLWRTVRSSDWDHYLNHLRRQHNMSEDDIMALYPEDD